MLEPGTRLGSYEIVGLLGAGGMGEVYRARDPRLDREVAVKVLPRALAEDPQALARFEREAKAVAALAHPNILSIYDFGTEAGVTYTVMELLDGTTLRERLESGGALPARKATELGRQVARALGAAHERGIVHRDLKPENIFLDREGRAKVLDFGLATERGESGGRDGTVEATRTSLTTPGAIMGTVGYMAPEQVRGAAVDHRADIFAFGCVLYEMLTGRRAFDRETPAETMTAILKEEPLDPESTTAAIPAALARVVRRCLEKRPEERFQSSRDLAFAIDNTTAVSGVDRATDAVDAPVPRRRGRGWPLAAAILAVVGVVAGFALGTGLAPSDSSTPVRVRTLTVSGADSEPTASPDGQLIAFTSVRDGTPRIWIKQLPSGGEQPLTEGPDSLPRFSPDGSTLLYVRDEGGVLSLYRQSLIGGQPRKLVHDAGEGVWSPDGSEIAFLRNGSSEGRRKCWLGVADAQEGGERIVLEVETQLSGLAWSPDGGSIVAVDASVTGNNPDYRFLFVDPDDGETERIKPLASGNPIASPAWSGLEELVVVEAGSLLGDQGDGASRVHLWDRRTGEARTLFWAQNIFPLQGVRSDFGRFDILDEGRIVYHQTAIRQGLREVEIGGGETPASEGPVLTRTEGRDRQPTYSPDGRSVLFSSNRSGNLDLWSVDLEDGSLRQITDDSAQDWDPAYSPDGRHIVWSSDRGGHLEIWMSNADGSGARQVTRDGRDAENPTMTADGAWIVYWSANPEKVGVWKIRPDGSDATQVASGSFLGTDVSPDGRYAAFFSMELDALRNVIHVVDLESGDMPPFRIEIPAPPRTAFILFGRMRWMPDGRSLAFVGVDERGRTGIYVQDFVPGQEDTSTSRRALAGFSDDFITESFGISPDGRRMTLSTLERAQRLMLADGVSGVKRPE